MVLVPLSGIAPGLHPPDFRLVKSCQAHTRPLKHPINSWVLVMI